MLNLQEAKQVASESTEMSRSVSVVQFGRVVGSIGGSLVPSIIEHSEDNEALE